VGGVVEGERGTGQVKLTIRLQFDFRPSRITFVGSSDSVTVDAIRFGDRPIWAGSSGLDVEGLEEGLNSCCAVRGYELKAGTDVVVVGRVLEGDRLAVTVIGEKRLTPVD